MTKQPDLCLGTAQFGFSYGITNSAGQVSEGEVAIILQKLEQAGIHWLDTAQAYGNAEMILGRCLPKVHSLRFISKLPGQSEDVIRSSDVDAWEQNFKASCSNLSISCLDAFLLHSPCDLLKPGGHLLENWLFSLRERGLVKSLGVSIYDSTDLEGVNPAFLDHVQLPMSLYDQRLLNDGTVSRLKNIGATIHARSVYLQGLLLKPANEWPGWICPELRKHHSALETFARQKGCSLIDLALGFVREQTQLDGVVVGICSMKELKELKSAWSGVASWRTGEWRDWAWQHSSILDPRTWQR